MNAENLKDRILHPEKYLPEVKDFSANTYRVAVMPKIEAVSVDEDQVKPSYVDRSFVYVNYQRAKWLYARKFKEETAREQMHRMAEVMKKRAMRLLERELRDGTDTLAIPGGKFLCDFVEDDAMRGLMTSGIKFSVWRRMD